MAIGEPVWELAERFPRQGHWTERAFLALPEGYPRVELTDGRLDVLPIPTDKHQAILSYLLLVLVAYAKQHGGWARPAGLRVRLGPERMREPDVCFLSADHGAFKQSEFWTFADLVVEVVSDSPRDRDRDYVDKRREYAEARIPEYWIVDPAEQRITVLALGEDGAYGEHGVYPRGDDVTSASLTGLVVSASDILDAD
jgi:Uma2 family endonuclease